MADPLDEPRLRGCLERGVELAPVRLRLRDWPGIRGPVVCLGDPALAVRLGERLAPAYRVLHIELRDVDPRVQAEDVRSVLRQFGFARAVLVGGAATELDTGYATLQTENVEEIVRSLG